MLPTTDNISRGKNRRWCALGVCCLMFLMGLSMVTDAGINLSGMLERTNLTI